MGAMRSRLPLAEQRDEVEFRRCGVVCQKGIQPQRCLEQGCPFLYAYEAFGHKFAGCLQGVFGVAIEVEHLTRARKRRNGFGAIRAVREPLGCINPEFYELPDRPSFRVIENTRPTA